MERKIRYIWWGVLGILFVAAIWKFFLPHNAAVSIEKTSSNREIVVYVAGAVKEPGLVHLPIDARLNDALKQVTPLPEANIDQMNPAEKLKDGQKITVPYKSVAQVPGEQNSTNPSVNAALGGNGSASSTVPLPNSASPVNSNSGQININTAGVSELDKLPGIGPALAERIIQYRNDHGAFSKPEDLQEVSGIGAKTYEKMASMLTVGP
ncbi:helix-hairpin-helix domain-containing protein [Desulfitobacterium metallireducens]|uniref:Competence protein ComEA n=1 Tax=Desulfitobacterium metallireducens DSM 15288 TaxID=871968 RepID=W0EFA4_9FIRM|nr:helix-hairpin-helix domain-containing protein [Desulfitobacterium metallireducens]AHF07884.1 competence protein ComEA [Desulfitobacterium metallireducens DSM 15288]